jgi:hypothetical protein
MMRFAGILLGLLLATASQAQFPSLRVLPQAPLASHRVYLEVDLTPCRIITTDVISHGPDIRVVELLTGSCQATLPTTGKVVVPLGFFPEGGARVGVSVDGVHRTINFQVAAPRQGGLFPDDGTPIVGNDRRADHSLEVGQSCPYDLVVESNDARTEIVVDQRPNPVQFCLAAPPPLPPARIGFPTPGPHLVILKVGGVVARTELITVTSGFEKLDYSDLWGVEAESGWGLTLKQHGRDRVFIAIYGYRADGRPLWLSMQAPDWESATRLSGSLFITAGNAQSGPFDASRTASQIVGEAVVEFTSPQSALLTIRSLTSRASLGLPAQRSWTLRRQGF